MRQRAWFFCVFAMTLVPSVAIADDDVSPPDDAQSLVRQAEDAQALVRQGVELRREHRNQEALDAFRSAQKLVPSPRTRAQVALAEQALGEWLNAADDLDAVLAITDDEWITRNREALLEARTTVEGHLAFLTVDIIAPRRAQIDLDGRVIVPGTEARVLAGPGTLITSADEFAPDVQRLTLTAGEHRRIAVSLIRIGSRLSSAPPEVFELAPPSRRSRAVAGPVALASFGLMGIATGSIFGLRTIHEKNERDAQCVGGCTAAGIKFDSRARSAATISDVAFGAGAVLLLGGGLWWFLSGPRGTRLGAIVVPGACGVTLSGTL